MLRESLTVILYLALQLIFADHHTRHEQSCRSVSFSSILDTPPIFPSLTVP